MVWDKAVPAASTGLKASNPQMLENNNVLEAALNAEHNFATGGTQDGLHKQGSTRCFFQDSAPSTRIDGDAFTSADFGSLWIDSNSSPDNLFSILTAIGPVTWTPISANLIAAAHTWTAIQTFAAAIISTLATGTAPFTVASTTKVSNLNADKVDGFDVTAFAGEESHTLPGGMIIKQGSGVSSSDNSQDFNFAVAFPNSCDVVQITRRGANISVPLCHATKSTTKFTINRHSDIEDSVNFDWIAIGY